MHLRLQQKLKSQLKLPLCHLHTEVADMQALPMLTLHMPAVFCQLLFLGVLDEPQRAVDVPQCRIRGQQRARVLPGVCRLLSASRRAFDHSCHLALSLGQQGSGFTLRPATLPLDLANYVHVTHTHDLLHLWKAMVLFALHCIA